MKENLFINDCLSQVAHDQFVVKCSIDASQRGGVSKILTARANSTVSSAEALDGECSVSGKVTYKLLYIDKEGKPQGLDYFCDFEEKIESEDIRSDMQLLIESSVEDISFSISGDEIRLSAVCDVKGNAVRKTEIKYLDFEEGYCVKRKTQERIELSRLPDITFEINEEVEAQGKADRVLFFDATATISKIDAEKGRAEGLAIVEIVYVVDDEIKSKRVSFPFDEEIEEGNCNLTAYVKSSRLVLSGADDDVIFNVELLVTLKGFSTNVANVDAPIDVFSTEKYLKCESERLPCRKYVGTYDLQTVLSVSADGDKLIEGSKVLANTVGVVNVANLIPRENSVTVEGLASVNVLYLADGAIRAVDVEMPFSVDLVAEGIRVDDHLEANAVIKNVTVGVASDVLKLTAEAGITLRDYRTFNLEWISSCEVGEEKPLSPYGFSVYYLDKGNDPWQIAKALDVDPSSLENIANEDMEKLTVFRKREQ